MVQRLLSAFVALLIVLPILFLGGTLGVQLLVGAVLLVVLYEFGPVASPNKPKQAFAAMAPVGGALYALMSWGPHGQPLIAATVLGVGFLLSWAMFAHEDPIEGAVAGAIAGVAVPYLALAMAFVGWVRALEPDGLTWIFYVLIMTWAADTGAYFAGRFFGKRKLLERISPKKTWEGVWGGVALSVVISLAWMVVYPLMPMVHAAILGAALAGCGVVGDLVESMFKRARGIKDSGGIMPGHGGLFDRVDSLLFTMPVAWAYATVFGLT